MIRPNAKLPADKMFEISVDAIEPNPHQPREDFDQSGLDCLAQSIRSDGVLQNVLVRPAGNGKYQLIAGERRWRAAKQAGKLTITARVVAVDDATAAIMLVAENLQRDDLDPIERGRAFELLMSPVGAGMNAKSAAKMVGVSEATVRKYRMLAALPEPIRERVRDGRLTIDQGAAFIRVKDQSVLSQACLDLDANPWDWCSTEDVELNLSEIAEQLESSDATSRAPASEPKADVATRPAKPATKQAAAKKIKNRGLNFQQALRLVRPYRRHRESLELIIAQCTEYLEDLK